MVQTISSPHCIIGTRMTRIERMGADFCTFGSPYYVFFTSEAQRTQEDHGNPVIKKIMVQTVFS